MSSLYRTWMFNNRFSNVGWTWPWYDLKHGTRNLIAFFPVIFNWRYWDYCFFFRVIVKMLELKEKGFTEEKRHVGWDRDVKKMKIARLLLERVIEDEYNEMVYKDHDVKWGDSVMRSEPCDEEFQGEKMYTMHFDRPNANTPELIEQERVEYRRLMKKPDQMRQRDLNLAMKIIGKYGLGWWT